MEHFQEARVKLTNTQSNKSNSAAKIKAGTILRLNKKNLKMKNYQKDKQLK